MRRLNLALEENSYQKQHLWKLKPECYMAARFNQSRLGLL